VNPKLVELALKKQRLQIRSAALRQELAAHAAVWRPAFTLADRGQAAWLWLRRHPALPVALLVAVLVARPRAVLSWARRGFFVWQTFARLRDIVLTHKP